MPFHQTIAVMIMKFEGFGVIYCRAF